MEQKSLVLFIGIYIREVIIRKGREKESIILF